MKKMATFTEKKSCCGGGCGTVKTRASVMDGKLVLSLGKSVNPVVWQTDLTEASISSFEVIEKSGSKKSGADTLYILSMKTGKKGESVEIAPFANKDDAVEALMATSAALHSGTVQTHAHTPVVQGGGKKSLLRRIVSVLFVLLVLWMIWSYLTYRKYYALENTDMGNAPAPFAQEENGVPLSADDVLRGME